MPIALCGTDSFQGEHLSGYDGYQAIENYHYTSLETYNIACGSPSPGYSLSGDVPPGLECETPDAEATRLVSSKIGTLFANTSAMQDVVKYYTPFGSMSFPFPESDQGVMNVNPQQTGTTIYKTFNFTLVYDGRTSSGSSCQSSLPLTMSVLLDQASQSELAVQEIQSKIEGGS